MAKSFPAATAAHHAPVLSPSRTAPSVRAWLDSCSRHQPLSERTVLELSRCIHRWQQHPAGPDHAPDQVRRKALRARDQLVRHNLRLISHTWCRHRSSLPPEDEGTADAFQEAAIALVRAAEKYDPSRGYCFSTYASFWVRRGFSEHERRGRRMIRLPHDKAALVLRAQRLAREKQALTGSLPSLDWLAACCGTRNTSVKTSQLQELLLIWWRSATAELDRPGGGAGDDGAGLPLLERIAAPADGNDPEHSLLHLLPQRLNPLQRRLLWHRYLREHPLNPRQIQKVMGLKPEEQQRLEEEALELLRQGAMDYTAR
jgi:RNA polymerase sigma factor (sigma-70 family)